MAPKIFASSAKFKPVEVINILREAKANPALASHDVQVFNLVGGQAYVYSDTEKKSDWKSDSYRFVIIHNINTVSYEDRITKPRNYHLFCINSLNLITSYMYSFYRFNTYQTFKTKTFQPKTASGDSTLVEFKEITAYLAVPPPPDSKSNQALKTLGFKRFGFWLTESPNYVLVQYVGDSKLYKEFSHGNKSDKSSKYVTTNKSTRDAIKQMGRDGEKPGNVYKHMTRLGVGEDTSVAEIMVKLPRNHRQVVNLKKTALDKDKRSHDALYNAYCVAGELKDGTFVKSYNIYPRLQMTLLDDRLGDELGFLLKVCFYFISCLQSLH
jgi:hypothetical protein